MYPFPARDALCRNTLYAHLNRAGISAETLGSYDVEYLSIREREIVQNYCQKIFRTPKVSEKSELRTKIIQLLQKTSLTQLRTQMKDERQDGIDVFLRSNHNGNWSEMTQHQKNFFNRLADLEFLRMDFERS